MSEWYVFVSCYIPQISAYKYLSNSRRRITYCIYQHRQWGMRAGCRDVAEVSVVNICTSNGTNYFFSYSLRYGPYNDDLFIHDNVSSCCFLLTFSCFPVFFKTVSISHIAQTSLVPPSKACPLECTHFERGTFFDIPDFLHLEL